MSLDRYLAVFSAAVGFFTLVVAYFGLRKVSVQIRDATRQREADTRQREADSLVKIYDTNRELVSLGFPYPELFGVLKDAETANPEFEQHYLQMWLNHFAMIGHGNQCIPMAKQWVRRR